MHINKCAYSKRHTRLNGKLFRNIKYSLRIEITEQVYAHVSNDKDNSMKQMREMCGA